MFEENKLGYIVVKENHGFSPAWVLTKEQLIKFFGECLTHAIEDGISSGDHFILESGTERYLVSRSVLPFYFYM